jgi:hypothetical protein
MTSPVHSKRPLISSFALVVGVLSVSTFGSKASRMTRTPAPRKVSPALTRRLPVAKVTDGLLKSP